MKRNLQYIISLMLLALMLFKVSSFHAYTHHDDSSDEIENCNICDSAIENQNAEFIFTASQTIKFLPVSISQLNPPMGYSFDVSPSFLRFSFFGRPPPNMG